MAYDSESGNIKIALTGDSLVSRRLSVFEEDDYLSLVELLRESDAAVTNAEMLFHNFEDYPTVVPGGTYMRADPSLIRELEWMGINLFAAANNHNYDYGESGLLTHIRNLDESGVAYAGIGRNMGEAREPRYLDTAAGRIALISVTLTGSPQMYAGHQWRDGKGRPGANMIRYTTTYTVDRNVFRELRRMRDELKLADRIRRGLSGQHRNHTWGIADEPDTASEFFMPALQSGFQYPIPDGCRIAMGETFSIRLVPNESDVVEILQRIADARSMADWVIVSMHNHEQGDTVVDPSGLAVEFAHAAIEAGTDVFHGHGPHRDRGIEIYMGKPIFYSLGHFIFQNDTVERMPRENMVRQGLDAWEATPGDFYNARSGDEGDGEWTGLAGRADAWRDVVGVVEFRERQLAQVTLHPIELGFKRPRGQRGRPVIASPDEAREVLELFRRLSSSFGTRIDVSDGIGKIEF